MASIHFVGEEVAGRKIHDLCNYDDTKKHMLYMNDCAARELATFESFFEDIVGYDTTETQALQHVAGDLQWVTLP